MRIYTAIVERCQDTGFYVGFIPGFQGAHTQAETLDELNQNLREVVAMLLEDGAPVLEAEFVGTQNVVGLAAQHQRVRQAPGPLRERGRPAH
jgi:predicted RNase H-like HicB family nuclease